MKDLRYAPIPGGLKPLPINTEAYATYQPDMLPPAELEAMRRKTEERPDNAREAFRKKPPLSE